MVRYTSFDVFRSRKSPHWATPKALFVQLNREFRFTLDPCPLHGDAVDGLGSLSKSWSGQRIYCNPPYGPEIPKWLIRWSEADIAVYLLPARTDNRWFHDIVLLNAKEVRFLRGRLSYNETGRAPFPSMVVVFEAK